MDRAVRKRASRHREGIAAPAASDKANLAASRVRVVNSGAMLPLLRWSGAALVALFAMLTVESGDVAANQAWSSYLSVRGGDIVVHVKAGGLEISRAAVLDWVRECACAVASY